MDAEEIMPRHVNMSRFNDLKPSKFELRDNGQTKPYRDYWKFWPSDEDTRTSGLHDIDLSDQGDDYEINSWYVYNGAPTRYLCLDPTDPDTDGDGVPDGVEIMDDDGDWPDQIDKYDSSQATNPLDPNDYNTDEVGRTADYYR